jgi:neutral ceramidase
LIQVGAAVADITPAVGTHLSGFIARENMPSTHIDSALHVRAIMIQYESESHCLLNYDLLGLGTGAAEFIKSALEREIGPGRFLLTATHTHSGPVVGLLLGEPPPSPEYLELLAERSVAAARTAQDGAQLARLLWAEIPMPGLTYNRRALLVDGRVSIMPEPDLPVVQRGPLDERMTLLVWQSKEGKNIVSLAHYACHGVAVLSSGIGSDIPGALAEAIGQRLGAPCLFLQGAAGDVNPTVVTATRAEMLAWVERALRGFAHLTEVLQPVEVDDFQAAEAWLDLPYAILPGREEVQKQLSDLLRIANGDMSAPDLQDAVGAFKNTMNIPPDAALDPQQSRFVALALAESASLTLAAIRDGGILQPQKLHLAAWRIGELLLVFLACEALTSTDLRLRALRPETKILPMTYLAPLLGYLPDREALCLGGYEVSEAWRFYGHPAPFADDSEERLVAAVANLLAGM